MIFPTYDTHFRDYDPVTYQRDCYDAALGYCKTKRVAVDAGAHVGIFTTRMLEDFEKVVAFEPQPDNFICLSDNCPQAERHNVALWDRVGNAKLISPRKDNSGAWEMVPGDKIRTMTLDVYKFDHIDLIKIDVQGSEEGVLLGAKETIQRCKPVILIECYLKGAFNTAITNILEPMGYKPKVSVRKDTVFSC